jgi:putative aldouronate transport system permease protein
LTAPAAGYTISPIKQIVKETGVTVFRKNAGGKKRGNFQLFSLALPGMLVVFVFCYLPMAGLLLAFKDFNIRDGFFKSPWVGFRNFAFLFQSRDALRITRNALLNNFLFISVAIVLALLLALILFELSSRLVKIYQTILFFPYFLSWVVVGYSAYVLLSSSYGVINSIIVKLGGVRVNWYNDSKYWLWILLIAYLWKNLGYLTIIFYTALMGIDPSLYEAGRIDGAGNWQIRFRISIPLVLPVVMTLALLNIGRIFFSDFGLFYFIPRNVGALYPVTDVIDTYVYRALRVTGDIGMSSAAGLYQSFMGLVLILITNALVKRARPESALL